MIDIKVFDQFGIDEPMATVICNKKSPANSKTCRLPAPSDKTKVYDFIPDPINCVSWLKVPNI